MKCPGSSVSLAKNRFSRQKRKRRRDFLDPLDPHDTLPVVDSSFPYSFVSKIQGITDKCNKNLKSSLNKREVLLSLAKILYPAFSNFSKYESFRNHIGRLYNFKKVHKVLRTLRIEY